MTALTPPSSAIAGVPMSDEELAEWRAALEPFAIEPVVALNAARALLREVTRLRAALAEAEGRDAAMREDAERWRAVMGCQRVRILGGARLGTPEALIGAEFYMSYPTGSKTPEHNALAVAKLTDFADAARRSAPGERTP